MGVEAAYDTRMINSWSSPQWRDLRKQVELGLGFDSTQGIVKEESCLEAFSVDPEIPNGRGRGIKDADITGGFYERDVRTAQSQRVSVDAAFEYGAYSGKAAYESISSRQFVGRTLTATVDKFVDIGKRDIRAPKTGLRLTDAAKRKWDQAQSTGNIKPFITMCGDVHISSIGYGALYHADIDFVASTEDEFDSMSVELGGGLNTLTAKASGNAKFQQQFSSWISTKKVSFRHFYAGDNYATPAAECRDQVAKELKDTSVVAPPNAKPSDLASRGGLPLGDDGRVDEILAFARTLGCRVLDSAQPISWRVAPYPGVDLSLEDAGASARALIRIQARKKSLQDATDNDKRALYLLSPTERDEAVAEKTTLENVWDQAFAFYRDFEEAPHVRRNIGASIRARKKAFDTALAPYGDEKVVLDPIRPRQRYTPSLLGVPQDEAGQPRTIGQSLDRFSDHRIRVLELRGRYTMADTVHNQHFICPSFGVDCNKPIGRMEIVLRVGAQTGPEFPPDGQTLLLNTPVLIPEGAEVFFKLDYGAERNRSLSTTHWVTENEVGYSGDIGFAIFEKWQRGNPPAWKAPKIENSWLAKIGL
jgi:hypothetical protein